VYINLFIIYYLCATTALLPINLSVFIARLTKDVAHGKKGKVDGEVAKQGKKKKVVDSQQEREDYGLSKVAVLQVGRNMS